MVVLTTFSQPTEGIRHRQPNTTAYVNDNNLGKGTLYIAESCLSWISDSGDGFSIEYCNISLHAVSRDLTAFSQECLFLMLDIALGDEETKSENADSNDDSDDVEATTELRFVPDDRGMLDAMFHTMNVCQALHPDPEDSVSDEDLYEVTDDDIQMEETDSRMANLNIHENGNAFSLHNKNTAFDLRGSGQQDRVVEGMVEGMEGVVDRVVDRVVNRLVGEGMEGAVVDRAVDRVADRLVGEDMGEGRVADRLVAEDMEEGREVGRGVDDEDMRSRMTDVDMGEGRVLEEEVYRAQHDRLFLSSRPEDQNYLHYLEASYTASHFSDAES